MAYIDGNEILFSPNVHITNNQSFIEGVHFAAGSTSKIPMNECGMYLLTGGARLKFKRGNGELESSIFATHHTFYIFASQGSSKYWFYHLYQETHGGPVQSGAFGTLASDIEIIDTERCVLIRMPMKSVY